MDYRYIFRRAWQIGIRHPSLWLAGLLVSLSGLTRVNWRGTLDWLPAWLYRPLYQAFYGRYTALFVILFVLIALLVSFGLALLNALGRGALTAQTNHIENGGAPSVRRGLTAGRRRLWPVLLVVLLPGLPLMAIRLVGFAPYLAKAYVFYLPPGPAIPAETIPQTLSRLLLCLLPAFLLSLTLEMPTRTLQRLGVCACVLEDQPVVASLRRAWQLERTNFLSLLLFWLMLTAIEIVVVITSLGVLALPALTLSAALQLLVERASFSWADALYGAVLLGWTGAVIIDGVTEAFLAAAWTVAYRDLTGLGLRGDEGDRDKA